MRVGLRTVRVVKPADETELFTKRRKRLGRFTKRELAVASRPGKPAPLFKIVLGLRERHAVGRVDGAKTAWNLAGHFRAHGVKNRKRERNTSHPPEESTAVDLE